MFNRKSIFAYFLLALVFAATLFLQSKIARYKPMDTHSTFACAINCMDGRTQDAVKNFMQEHFGVDYVDMVTEPGPNKILADNAKQDSERLIVENIQKRVGISVQYHGTKYIAIVGHFGCAGNPVSKEEQIKHLREAKKTVESFGFHAKLVLLWVDQDFKKALFIE